MADTQFDVIIIGGGPGGYVTAIRGAQLGLKICVVEKNHLGGICLNWGCIPTKALLRTAEIYHLMNHAEDYGLTAKGVGFDLEKIVERSRGVSGQLSNGVAYLLKKNKVTVVDGEAKLAGPGKVDVTKDGKALPQLSAKYVIVATGAKARSIPSLPIDGRVVITSREALETREVPARALIVGAGATGTEFAYVWRMYGSDVTLVEMLPRIVPSEDEEISQQLEHSFERHGINTRAGTRVDGIEIAGGVATVSLSGDSGAAEIDCDKVLVAIGMQGNVDGIGLEDVGVATAGDFITVGDHMETNVPGVYAIGDVTGKMLLAHVASAQGVTAVETMAGLDPPSLDYAMMPRATYCRPQVASFGLTEAQAKAQGYSVKTGKFPMVASGKALALGETEGMVKVVVDAEIGSILGAHMIGAEVTELLGELGLANLLESTTKELGWLVHPHPTISEALKEAALSADGEAIHA